MLMLKASVPQESQLSSQEKLIRDMREELAALKESEAVASTENKSMNGELADLRLQLERLRYDSKEAAITSDSLKEQNSELERELEDLRVRALHARAMQSDRPNDLGHAEIARGCQSDAEVGRAGGQGQEEGRADGSDDGGLGRCEFFTVA